MTFPDGFQIFQNFHKNFENFSTNFGNFHSFKTSNVDKNLGNHFYVCSSTKPSLVGSNDVWRDETAITKFDQFWNLGRITLNNKTVHSKRLFEDISIDTSTRSKSFGNIWCICSLLFRKTRNDITMRNQLTTKCRSDSPSKFMLTKNSALWS
jgi:hypothetical protein